jgi:acetyltransferase-like isoleucine patch superfamily enzyme
MTDAIHATPSPIGSARASAATDPQTELRKALADRQGSALAKYRAINVGRPGVMALFAYEWRTMLLGPVAGGVGVLARQKLYPKLFAHFGRGVVVGRNVVIRHPHRIHLGDRVVIDDNCVLDAKGDGAADEPAIVIGDDAIIGRNTALTCKGGSIALGEHANISVNCTLISETKLTVGRKTLIAGHCYIIAGGNHGIERVDVPIIDQPRVQRGGVRIAENAWLAASVTVIDGVTIGRDAVIAAGAVVTRDVPAFGVAAGVPARLLRMRGAAATEKERG